MLTSLCDRKWRENKTTFITEFQKQVKANMKIKMGEMLRDWLREYLRTSDQVARKGILANQKSNLCFCFGIIHGDTQGLLIV